MGRIINWIFLFPVLFVQTEVNIKININVVLMRFSDYNNNTGNYEFSVSLNLPRIKKMPLIFVHSYNVIIHLLALWACVEYCLSLISRPGLLGGVRHLVITAFGALSLHLQTCAIVQ